VTDESRRVLVVDDDRAMVRTLCDVLQLAGWEPEGAFSGEEAIQRAAQGSFAAVLMDVRMSGITGVDALRGIRQRRPTLPVILMTAYSSGALLQEAQEWGVTRVLPKPLPIDALLQLLTLLQHGRRAVLLVDDDPDFLRSLSALLTARGYSVQQARTPEAAVAELQQHPASVVLLDLKLDDLDPREVLAAIRRSAAGAAIILYSGHASLLEETVSRLNDRRVLGFLRKPFGAEQLTRILDDVLG
jgi:DNA-binding NtrC family response regulator